MITEKGFSERSQVIVMVSSSGETERPITVFFTTSDDTATGYTMPFIKLTLSLLLAGSYINSFSPISWFIH